MRIRILIISCFIYCIGISVGLYIYKDNNSTSLYTIDKIENNKKRNYSKKHYFYNILSANSKVISINIFGFITCGFLSVISTFYNGLLHGFIFLDIYQSIPLSVIVKKTVFHSIEIIAIIWSCYIGLILSYKILSELRDKNQETFSWKEVLLNCFLWGV